MLRETDLTGLTIDKVQRSIERLRAFEPPEGYYLAQEPGSTREDGKDERMGDGRERIPVVDRENNDSGKESDKFRRYV